MSILAILGCGKKNESSGSTSIEGTPGNGGSISDLRATANGWNTGCLPINLSNSKEAEFKVSGVIFVHTEISYGGAGCSTAQRALRATATLEAKGTSGSYSSATALDIIVSKLEIQVLSTAVANSYNSSSYCGKTDWAVNGQWFDMTGLSCSDTAPIYDIFKITGSQVVFGNKSGSNDGSSTLKRPTTLESGGYTKY